jgi:hypothetical protein
MILVWQNGTFSQALSNRSARGYSRRRPLAVCTSCGALDFQSQPIGALCAVKRNGKQCRGFIASAAELGIWERCLYCENTRSLKKTKNCSHCCGGRWRCVAPAGTSERVKAAALVKAAQIKPLADRPRAGADEDSINARFGRPKPRPYLVVPERPIKFPPHENG